MSEPLVCAVMLTRDRPAMAARAVRCFSEQTYQRKRLIILDAREHQHHVSWDMKDDGRAIVIHSAATLGLRKDLDIGRLRQVVNLGAQRIGAGIIVHWDDDDWSHPNRIAEQVALLQASGKECVGYREMLFWRDMDAGIEPNSFGDAQAWLYSNTDPRACLGTSLCYWRRVWEARPFPEMNNLTGSGRGEDLEWLRGVDSLGVSGLNAQLGFEFDGTGAFVRVGNINTGEPRMIASIHAGNARYYAGLERSNSWRRVPEWDAHCRETMRLEVAA